MTKMIEALNRLYNVRYAISRQISLFSICGIAGILQGSIILGIKQINDITSIEKILYTLIIMIIAIFLVGYEVQFINERRIPDITFEAFKIALKKTPFIVVLMTLPTILIGLFTQYHYNVFCISTLIAIPASMLLIGFSYNFRNNEAFKLFKKFRVKEYFLILLKELWVIFYSYLISFVLLFIIFFIFGFVMAIIHHTDITSFALSITQHKIAINKLSTYIISILANYTLTIGNLVWMYEIMKTYEGGMNEPN